MQINVRFIDAYNCRKTAINVTLCRIRLIGFGFWIRFYKQVFGSVLFSYVLRPGTVFFLGYDSNYDKNTFGHFDRNNYNIFLKFSYWWRM